MNFYHILFTHIFSVLSFFLLICVLPVKQIFRNPDGHRLYATCYHPLIHIVSAAETAQRCRGRIKSDGEDSSPSDPRCAQLTAYMPLAVRCPSDARMSVQASLSIHAVALQAYRTKSRIRNCCADPARNKLCHTGTARKASVPVMILCRNSITDTGADDRRPCEAVRSDSCTFFLLKCPAKPFRRIETTACGIFLLFLVCHRITPAGGDVNPFLISQFSQPLPLSTHRSFPAAPPLASFR